MLVSNEPRNVQKDKQLWRDLVAFWIFGLCNNYGYVIMLSAAHDIMEEFTDAPIVDPSEKENERLCHLQSTGTVLLADILPQLIIKILAPFLPFMVNVRIFFAIATAAAGFLCVGWAKSVFIALLGVVLTSFGSGLGETTFLSYSSRFNKNVISTWSSGTGGAGVFGSLSYAGLKALNIDTKTTMLLMLLIPLMECIAFWILLRRPSDIKLPTLSSDKITVGPSMQNDKSKMKNDQVPSDEEPLISWKDKFNYIIFLMKYIIPLVAIYLAEYFINQGLFELVYFQNIFIDKAAQYRWLCVDYQIGVFVSRSTVNLYPVDKIWLLMIFQFINVVYFLFEVIYYVTPTIWIAFAIVFWEGLLGGGAYVNTFYKMSKEISTVRQQFAMSIVAVSDAVGISIAGVLAIPVHNAICGMPAYTRFKW